MDKKLLETTNLRVEIMNRERQVKEKLGQVVRIRAGAPNENTVQNHF